MIRVTPVSGLNDCGAEHRALDDQRPVLRLCCRHRLLELRLKFFRPRFRRRLAWYEKDGLCAMHNVPECARVYPMCRERSLVSGRWYVGRWYCKCPLEMLTLK